MAQHGNNIIVIFGILVTITTIFRSSLGHFSKPETCPTGWIDFRLEAPFTCVWVSNNTVGSLTTAHDACMRKNSSLIIIESEVKLGFFKRKVDRIREEESTALIWIGLQKYDTGVRWLTINGTKPVKSLPKAFSSFNDWIEYFDYNRRGLYFNYDNELIRPDTHFGSGRAYYICEKPSFCKNRFYGSQCDRECHCNGHCDIMGTNVTCPFGCQVGWMGPDCSQRKEIAAVNYMCVNSTAQGKFAFIRIVTKGVRYQAIHAVNNKGLQIPWCNNTVIWRNDYKAITIKIYVNRDSELDIVSELCPGLISGDDHFEWRFIIQERKGLVSRNDQEINIECDFKKAEPFLLSINVDIKRNRWFRRFGIMRPVQYLEERRESLKLIVVDAATGNPISKAHLDGPVMLKIRYGLGEDGDSSATAVNPFNCSVISKGNGIVNELALLDTNGCPVEGSPVSAFSPNGSKSLITKPFPMFGLAGNRDVEFHCSYSLCFEGDICPESCQTPPAPKT